MFIDCGTYANGPEFTFFTGYFWMSYYFRQTNLIIKEVLMSRVTKRHTSWMTWCQNHQNLFFWFMVLKTVHKLQNICHMETKMWQMDKHLHPYIPPSSRWEYQIYLNHILFVYNYLRFSLVFMKWYHSWRHFVWK